MTQPTTTPSPPKEAPLPLGKIAQLFISEISYKLNPAFEAQGENTPLNIEIGVSVARSQLGERQVLVDLETKPLSNSISPYSISPYEIKAQAVVILTGFGDDIEAEKLDLHAVMLGAPLAFGALREQFLQLSARSPFPKFMLSLTPMRALLSKVRVFDSDGKLISKAAESPPDTQKTAT